MNEDRAQELRKILADSGSVTFIKSGQALSLRGDLVKNREYVRELTKLQARVTSLMARRCSSVLASVALGLVLVLVLPLLLPPKSRVFIIACFSFVHDKA